jgi:hypothetical protein
LPSSQESVGGKKARDDVSVEDDENDDSEYESAEEK